MNVGSFFAGVAMCSFLASAVFFLKFWRASRDRFFLHFALACGLLAVERILLLILLPDIHIGANTPESQAWIYLVRFTAFVVIIWAVIERNRKSV